LEFKHRYTDVVVVGSGGAGVRAAIGAADEGADVVLTEEGASGTAGATQCALWSIQAPFGQQERSKGDSPKVFFNDMLEAGRGLSDQNVLSVIAKTMCDRVRDLEDYGVDFKKTEEGHYYQTPFPGQSYPRSCYVKRNGHSIATILYNEAQSREDIRVKTDFYAYKLIKDGNRVTGVLGLDMKKNELEAILAKSTVLATGGNSSLWKHSDNPPTVTGDGVAMAYEAGAEIYDMEFNHFYGTDLIWPPSVKGTVLLYELLVPEFFDANVYNSEGEPLFEEPFPIRDEAIIQMHKEIQAGRGTPHGGLWYDLTKSNKSKEEVREIMENMTGRHYQFIKDAAGIDVVEEPVEVKPAAHYQCGGVRINEKGETSLAGLYACGEAEGNPLGANRLAGSALADTQAMGAQAGKHAALNLDEVEEPTFDKDVIDEEKEKISNLTEEKDDPIRSDKAVEDVKEVMMDSMYIIRSEEGMQKGLKKIRSMKEKVPRSIMIHDTGRFNIELAKALKAQLMIKTAELCIGSGLFRKESRGHHQRKDYPDRDDENWKVHTAVKLKNGKPSFSKKPVKTVNFDSFEV